jgi:hypothetical protein
MQNVGPVKGPASAFSVRLPELRNRRTARVMTAKKSLLDAGHDDARCRELRTAAFILDAADELNIKVGTNGVDVITVTTTRVPFETIRWLHAELVKHKREVIAAIISENAARTGELVPDAFDTEGVS